MSNSQQTISEVTRRAIIDYLSISVHWCGALEEHEFLARIYDLQRMPSTDYRKEYGTAYLDIWQHRIRNHDWTDDWVFTDSRFDLLYGPDASFLKFLAETVHPIVRPDSRQAEEIVSEYNTHLRIDGWELYVVKEISKRPVFGFRRIADGAQHPLKSGGDTQATGAQPQHPKAFVSHATLDHPFVEKFAADLRAKGVDAWLSKWEIKPGDSIRAKIEEGLEGCEYFIIVLSKNSINNPWVKTELDAATVARLNGQVQKIIPVKIEDCGDLPPTLASLCWEDFSHQPYDAALKRVIHSIFDIDVRPSLGTPPTAIPPHIRQLEVLTPTGRLIFEALCRNTIDTGFALIDDISPVVAVLAKQGISEGQIVETQDLLEELGYVKLRRTAGPAQPYCQSVMQLGFEKFANAKIPRFQNLIDTVRQRVLVQGDQLENAEIAKALGQPLRIVSHILEVMENRGWITLTREIGGGYESLRVDLVSPSLKRTKC